MHLEDAFHADVLDHPDDDAPRLIYADWLDEHGNAPRAEFIRVQCELARLAEDDPRRPELGRREAELLARHQQTWAAAVSHCGASWPVFRRGFIEAVDASALALLDHGEQLFRCAALRELTVHNAVTHLGELARQAWLARLRGLRLVPEPGASLHGLPAYRGFAALCRSPHLHALRMLDLTGCGLDPANSFLVCTRSLPGLVELGLADNGPAFNTISPQPWGGPTTLEVLDLSRNPITDHGAGWLARSQDLRALRWLNLQGCPIGEEGVTALLRAEQLPSLTHLLCDEADLRPAVRGWLHERRGTGR